jgi:hypothetical protein
MNKVHLKVAGSALVLAASCMSFGVQIWATDNLGTTNSGSVGDRVIRFDSANPVGTVTTLGSTGIANRGFVGLDFTAAGTLYGVTGFNSDGTAFGGSELYSFNSTTGAATLVGSLGLAAGNAATDMSWNPATGQMQVLTSAGSAGAQSLFTVNLSTGAATLVGAITGLPATRLLIGLSTNAAGVNFVHDIVADQMHQLSGLVATAMSSTVGADNNFSQGMTIDWSGNGNWYLGSIGATPSFFSDVRLMNNATGGTSSVLGTWPLHTNGLPQYETGDLAINPVPEPATIAVLSLGAMALLRKRRR